MSELDELLERLTDAPPAEFKEIAEQALAATSNMKWLPNPGKQTEAYLCEADVLLFGGEPGGGKSQLVLGLAYNEHQRSLIMRRQYGDLDRLCEDLIKIAGTRIGFNGSAPPKFKLTESQVVDFGAAARVGDEQNFMGKGHDFIGFDEATHFAQSQVRFLMGWLRTDDPNQRTRVVMATNPPLSAEGLWVIEMFAPWLDPRFAKPAKQGELRWVITDTDGKDEWVDGPTDTRTIIDKNTGHEKTVWPMSRTYINSSVKDNPFYAGTDYERQLDAMPEPYRSLLMGGFATAFEDQVNQIIPTAWVQMAQRRWTDKPPRDVPMCAMGVDCSGGGKDPMMIAPRYDAWFGEMIEVKGKDIPPERAGAHCGGIVLSYVRDQADITIDMGGGYGGPLYEHIHALLGDRARRYKGAESTAKRSRDGKMTFTNVRTAALWYMRELLDPGQPGGSPAALPPSATLLADLTAATFTVTPRGIQAEAKDKVTERLGRSTNEGDAAMMAWWNGPRALTNAADWLAASNSRIKSLGRAPSVILGSARMPMTGQRRQR